MGNILYTYNNHRKWKSLHNRGNNCRCVYMTMCFWNSANKTSFLTYCLTNILYGHTHKAFLLTVPYHYYSSCSWSFLEVQFGALLPGGAVWGPPSCQGLAYHSFLMWGFLLPSLVLCGQQQTHKERKSGHKIQDIYIISWLKFNCVNFYFLDEYLFLRYSYHFLIKPRLH